AEQQHALEIGTCGYKFLGHQVHAVVQTANVAKIRGAIEAENFRRFMMGSKQYDGPVVPGSEALIDACRQLLNLFVEFPVALDLGPARSRQLRESEPATVFTMPFQENLYRQQPLFNAFVVVQQIDSDA